MKSEAVRKMDELGRIIIPMKCGMHWDGTARPRSQSSRKGAGGSANLSRQLFCMRERGKPRVSWRKAYLPEMC